uniref:Uncharacterized protein n=1 Tax=Peronospora matthiolae TaxID=2874970 RepID=A0AAV1TRS1_9STRA
MPAMYFSRKDRAVEAFRISNRVDNVKETQQGRYFYLEDAIVGTDTRKRVLRLPLLDAESVEEKHRRGMAEKHTQRAMRRRT